MPESAVVGLAAAAGVVSGQRSVYLEISTEMQTCA